MNGAGANWQTMRSFTRDRSAAQRRLAPGTGRRVLRFAAPYRRQLTIFLVLIFVDAGVGAINPLLFRDIIDHGIRGHHVGYVEALAGVIAGLAVLAAGLSLAQRVYSVRVGEGLIYDMRAQVFAHVQRMPLAFFTRTQTGALISRLNSDVLGAQQAFTGTASSVASNVLTVSFTLGFMFALSWQITAVALVLLPVFVIPARLIGGRLQEITREAYGLNAEMTTTMTERFNVSGAMLVKLFGRPMEEDAAFRGRIGRVRDIGITTAMYNRVFLVSLTLVAALATALVYGVGGRFAAEGALPIGTIVALTAYLAQLYGPLTSLSNVRVDIMTALVSFERVFEVLDIVPAIADAPDARPVPVEAPASIEFRSVRFRYPSAAEVSLASLESVAVLDSSVPEEVLHGVEFQAQPGQLVALVGPSGAGKTTISQLVSRMYDVTGGAVLIGGVDVRQLTLASLRDTVGVVTQDAHLFHESIRDNLLFARPDASDDELWRALEQAQVADLVRSLGEGLDTLVGDRGYRLSGGEKQRIALARLLLKAPRIVVLDEATAHLDSESEAAVQQALSTALAGRTSLVIAHRLSTIRDADLILVVDDGRVVQSGRHEELLAAGGAYADLYRTQFAPQERDRPAESDLVQDPGPGAAPRPGAEPGPEPAPVGSGASRVSGPGQDLWE